MKCLDAISTRYGDPNNIDTLLYSRETQVSGNIMFSSQFRRPFCQKLKKKVLYRSEMARNAIESDFRTSKMTGGGHFVKN